VNKAAFGVGSLEALHGVFQKAERPDGLAGEGVAAAGDATDPAGGVQVVIPAARVFLHLRQSLNERIIAECADAIGKFGAVAGAFDTDANKVEIARVGAARVMREYDGGELLELGSEAGAEAVLCIIEAALEALAKPADLANEARWIDSAGVARRSSENAFALSGEHTFELGETAGVEARSGLCERHLEDVEITDFAETIPERAKAAPGDLDVAAIEPRPHDDEGLVQPARSNARGVNGVDVARGQCGFALFVQAVQPILSVGNEFVRERCVLGL